MCPSSARAPVGFGRDRRDVPLERKVAENRPTAASDRCGLVDRSVCNRVFGPAANPRWGAGAMIANDVVKCRLKPPERSDYYPTQLSDSEWATLREAFPTGVCDWSRPGVRQQPTVAWQTYADSSGGRPLGPRPRSSTCRARHCLGDAR